MIGNYATDKENGTPIENDVTKTEFSSISDVRKDLNKTNSIQSNGSDAAAQHTNDDGKSPVERVKFFGIEDNDSICSAPSDEDKLPPIPDGGWGWVVVASAFLVSLCTDGLAFSFGLLHEEFTDYFETTQSQTSMIGSLFIATPLLAGPIMSALVDRYGCRIMTMLAGILSTIGFLLASVSNSIPMLCLTYGFLSGSAMGILYVTCVVSVAFWFDKRRNLALSLASCGIGFGTVVYSPMTHYFLQMYDWRNTIVLLAGTLLNVCVCGALMRNPEWLEIKMERDKGSAKLRSGRSFSTGSEGSRSMGRESVLNSDELKALMKSGKCPEYILSTLATTIEEAEQLEATTQINAEQSYKRILSVVHLPTFIHQNEKVPVEVIEKLVANKRLYNVLLHNYPDMFTRRKSEINLATEQLKEGVNEPARPPITVTYNTNRIESEANKLGKKNTAENKMVSEGIKENTDLIQKKPKHKPHISNTAKDNPQTSHTDIRNIQKYLRDMSFYQNTLMHRRAMLNIPRHKLRTSSLPIIYKNSIWSLTSKSNGKIKWYHRLWETTKSTFDFHMFTEFHFLMYNLSSLILSVWFIPPYFFLNSYMTSAGVEGGAIMLSIIGVTCTIGIIVLGWAGDQPWINVIKTQAICIIICGLSIAAYPPFITNYTALTVISAIFGLSFASCFSYTPGILMELMPIDQFTVAYGLILLSQGIGHLIGPPMAGLLFDLTGTWELTFYVSGLWLVISGLCVGVVPFTSNVRLCGSAMLLKEAEEAKNARAVDV